MRTARRFADLSRWPDKTQLRVGNGRDPINPRHRCYFRIACYAASIDSRNTLSCPWTGRGDGGAAQGAGQGWHVARNGRDRGAVAAAASRLGRADGGVAARMGGRRGRAGAVDAVAVQKPIGYRRVSS